MRTRCPYRKTRSPVTIDRGYAVRVTDGEPVEIRPFIGAEASDAELCRCHELFVASTRQTFPGFPEQPYASFAAGMRSPRYLHIGPRNVWAGRFRGDEAQSLADASRG